MDCQTVTLIRVFIGGIIGLIIAIVFINPWIDRRFGGRP